MTISKNKIRYSITLLAGTYGIVDYIASETGLTRSEVIERLITLVSVKIPEPRDLIEILKNEKYQGVD